MSKKTKKNINQLAWELSNGDEFIKKYNNWLNNYQNWPYNTTPNKEESQFEKYIFPTYNGNKKTAYINTNNIQSTKLDPTTTNTDTNTNIGQYLALGAAGNIGGTLLGLGANAIQQQQQLQNQKELMDRQNEINLRNMQVAPQMQKIGMENAGMNPAMGAGSFASAPTVSQGAAGMGSMTIANVFDGIANIIAAAKAPSEIAQTKAQTGLTTAQTGKTKTETGKITAETSKIGIDINKINAEIDKLHEEIRNAKNINDMFDSANNFAKNQGPTIFATLKANLENSGAWAKMDEKSKNTIEEGINGKLPLDKGATEQLLKTIELERYFSESDAAIMRSNLELVTTINQMKDKKVMNALVKMPETTFKKLKSEMNRIYQQIENLKSQKSGIDIHNWSDIVNDPKFMLTREMWDELEKTVGYDVANDLWKFFQDTAKDRLAPGSGKNKTKKITTTKSGSGRTKGGNYNETTTTVFE